MWLERVRSFVGSIILYTAKVFTAWSGISGQGLAKRRSRSSFVLKNFPHTNAILLLFFIFNGKKVPRFSIGQPEEPKFY